MLFYEILFSALCAVLSNAGRWLFTAPFWSWLLFAASLVFLNLLPLLLSKNISTRRLRACRHGVYCLRGFLWSLPVGVIYHIALIIRGKDIKTVLFSALVLAIVEFTLFWNGIISVYLSSVQLGICHRTVGFLLGLVPIFNLFMLVRIIRIADCEVRFEEQKNRLNEKRRNEKICATRYPILLVHGVFFRDFKFPPYWGRIPSELQKNGAQVFFGEHSSALSVEDSGKELCARIKALCRDTKCEKVNVIAHSKGGLDIRAAAALCPQRIASITTINTPHRGCQFADYLLEKVPLSLQKGVAKSYNAAALKLGDPAPDFLSAVRDLTAKNTAEFGALHPLPQGVFCRSVGSVLKSPAGGKFPLNFTYRLAKHFDGANDGLVAISSFSWGADFKLLTPVGRRGISHGDVIDLNRENIEGFDVREFYVGLVSDLKNRGF